MSVNPKHVEAAVKILGGRFSPSQSMETIISALSDHPPFDSMDDEGATGTAAWRCAELHGWPARCQWRASFISVPLRGNRG
jgi:hypothetical protein